MAFLAQLEALTVTPDTDGRVVINASNGVIVMGEKVRIGKVAVSYRTARVTVGTTTSANAANATPDVFVIGDTTTVDDFVSALKAVGLKADVIIGVLQAVEKAGALFGSLVSCERENRDAGVQNDNAHSYPLTSASPRKAVDRQEQRAVQGEPGFRSAVHQADA